MSVGLTKEQIKALEEAAKPLLKFINDNLDPHSLIQVSYCDVEVMSGVARLTNDEFVKD